MSISHKIVPMGAIIRWFLLSRDSLIAVFELFHLQPQLRFSSTPLSHQALQAQEGKMGDLGREPIEEVFKEYYPLARDEVETDR